MKVLIVDDDYSVLDAVRETLEDEGYEVSIAANGLEALKDLREGGRPCLILLDLMMPVMNGWEFRREQLSDSLLASIPTVIVTAYVGPIPDGLGEAPKVRKPVKPEQLISLVETYCPKRGGAPNAVA